MNPRQPSQRTKTSSLPSSTTLTTIIITIMHGADIMRPVLSWCRRDTVVTITTTITAITAIKGGLDRMMKNRTSGSCFFARASLLSDAFS